MRSHRTRRFHELFDRLPEDIRDKARIAFKLWKTDPYHPSLHFKQVHASEPIVSARIALNWRALGIRKRETVVWFWIGSHPEYDKILSNLSLTGSTLMQTVGMSFSASRFFS